MIDYEAEVQNILSKRPQIGETVGWRTGWATLRSEILDYHEDTDTYLLRAAANGLIGWVHPWDFTYFQTSKSGWTIGWAAWI